VSHWLTCALCGLTKPVGIMSAQSWGSAQGASEPSYACPDCQAKYHDWRERLARIAGSSD
jgi:hypothetical protein